MKGLTVLGLDPGTTNFAYSVVSFYQKENKLSFKVKAHGPVKNTLKDLKDDPFNYLQKFGKEIEKLVDKHNPDYIVCERFTIRGFRTPTAEQITAMIGYLYGILGKRLPIYLYLAVTWKAAAKKHLGYKPNLDQFYKTIKTTPHELDATLLAFYQAGALSALENEKCLKRLKKQMEK